MKLLTKELALQMPAIHSQDGKSGPGGTAPALIKFFSPYSQWTWYATEANAVIEDADEGAVEVPLADAVASGTPYIDVLFFGLVRGDALEFGYFGLRELESVSHIERDLYWRPTAIGEIHAKLEAEMW